MSFMLIYRSPRRVRSSAPRRWLRVALEAARPLAFLSACVLAAILILFLERALHRYHWRLPLFCDVLAAGIFLYLSPELLPTWFLMFFVAFAAGYRWNLRNSVT